jgi:hypothetical protein
MQNPVLKKEFDAIINKREFHSNVTRLLQNQFGDHIVDLFDKDIMATVTKTGFCIILLYNLIPFKIPPSPSADNPDEPSTIAH